MVKSSKLMMFVAGAAIASAALFLTAGALGTDEGVYMLVELDSTSKPQKGVKGEWSRMIMKHQMGSRGQLFPTLEHCRVHAGEGFTTGQYQCVKIGTWKPHADMEVIR